jgi:hypothetical protein
MFLHSTVLLSSTSSNSTAGVTSDEMRHLVRQPSAGTRAFVPGGGGLDTSCCKPLEPSPVSWGAFAVVLGPVARLVHVGDAAFSLSLSVARDAQFNRRRALRQKHSSTQHPRKLPSSPPLTSLQPPPTYLHNSNIFSLSSAST